MRTAGLRIPICLFTAFLGAAMCFPVFGTEGTGPGCVLRVRQLQADISLPALMDPDHALWKSMPETPVALQRTPPLFSDGPFDDGLRPGLTVRLVRGNRGMGMIRLDWDDPTEDSPDPSKAFPDVGDTHIYKKHSREADVFTDAVCVMVPERRGAGLLRPSLVMGDIENPVELYFWRAGQGFRMLRATGRTTVERSGVDFPGHAVRRNGGWTAFLVVPGLEAATPLSIAVWDGGLSHRDGLKYYSIWYELE